MASYRELRAWKESCILARETYLLAMKLPPYELYALSSQMRRAVVSISSNIAEGSGRGTIKDYIRFLFQAKGSAHELETQLILCVELGFLNQNAVGPVLDHDRRVIWLIGRLIKSLEGKETSGQDFMEDIDIYDAERFS